MRYGCVNRMESFSLSHALFILHALSILAKTQLEGKFRSLYVRQHHQQQPPRAASEEETEMIERKGAAAGTSSCVASRDACALPVRASARLVIHSFSLAAYSLPCAAQHHLSWPMLAPALPLVLPCCSACTRVTCLQPHLVRLARVHLRPLLRRRRQRALHGQAGVPAPNVTTDFAC